MKFGFVPAAAVALTMAVATPAAAADNLLENGSFEEGFAGWTVAEVGGGTSPVTIAYNQASGYPTGAYGEAIGTNNVASASPDAVGNLLAYFSSDTANPHTLSQQVNLVNGVRYNLGFDYYAPANGVNNAFDATLGFLLNGNQIGSLLTVGSPGSNVATATWLNFGTSFVYTGATGLQTLSFQFNGLGNPAADFGVDRVYVTAAVPEPGTWALMLLGFGAVGFSMRRRRNTHLPALA